MYKKAYQKHIKGMSKVCQRYVKAIVKVSNVEMGASQGRVCMCPKDVQRIMGKQYTQARLFLIKIKKHLNKEDHQYISAEEFSKYTGLPLEEILRCML
jgi:hypothetical protein